MLGAFLPDEFDPAARAVFANADTSDFHAPEIWSVETGNAILMANRRGRIDDEMLRALLRDLAVITVGQDKQTRQNAWGPTLLLAQKHRLTLYDACYLELAKRLKAKLATMDQRLAAAAKLENVALAI